MISQQQLDIRRTQNMMHYDLAYVYSLGAESWASNFLLKDTSMEMDAYPSENHQDIIGVPIAEEIKQSGIDVGGISGVLIDASAGFPVNNLVNENGEQDQAYRNAFELLVLKTLPMNDGFPYLLADWVDKDDSVSSPGGAEDLDYLNLIEPNRPYRAANQPIASVSELRLLFALSEDAQNADNDYVALVRPNFNPLLNLSLEAIEQQPLINALPRGAKININTAPTVVLQSLVDLVDTEFSEEVVSEFVETRFEQPAKEANRFTDAIQTKIDEKYPRVQQGQNAEENEQRQRALQALESLGSMISVKSDYFYLYARAQIGDTELWMISLLHREENKATTLRRGIGVI
jgi:general secretion pathway protein K